MRLQYAGGAMDGFVSTYEKFHAARITTTTAPGAGPLLGTAPVAPPNLRQMARVAMGY